MPLFVHKAIKVRHHDSVISIMVIQVLVVGTTTYKNMVKIEGKLVPLEEYLSD